MQWAIQSHLQTLIAYWQHQSKVQHNILKTILHSWIGNDLRIHWRLIFVKVIRCSTQRLWVGYVIYFKFTPAVITTTQLHSTKPELRFCVGSNPACGVSEIHDGEDLWQWSRLDIKLNAFRRSTIPQKQSSSSLDVLNGCSLVQLKK